FAWNTVGLQGAILQMVNHGIIVVGLFFVIDILEDRTGTRLLEELGGLADRMRKLAAFFLIIIMAGIGLPLTNGFVGGFLLLKGLFQVNVWAMAIAGLTLIFGAVYMLRLFQKTMLGPLDPKYVDVRDIKGHEVLLLGVVVILIIVIGVYPNALLRLSEASVTRLVQQISF